MAATQELMETYDFTNMTPLQMRDAMMTLTKNGQMSLDESASLMLIAGLAGASPQTPNNGGANRPMDFFAATRELLAYNRHVHNVPGIDHAEKTLSALERLQGKPWRVDVSA